jgi:hypothetical protein
MCVSHKKNIARNLAHTTYDAIHAPCDIIGRFPMGARM